MYQAYWLGEFIKVFIGFFALFFLWPSIVFYPVFRKRSMTFWFSFCVTVQLILVSSVVLMLGNFHFLNDRVVGVLFYGTFVVRLLQFILTNATFLKTVANFASKSQGVKQLLLQVYRLIRDALKKQLGANRSAWIRRLVLLAVTSYGVLYYLYAPLTNPTFAFSDMNTHNTWVLGLIDGVSFIKGIYPEAMHCVAYALRSFFDLKTYSCMLYLAGPQVFMLIISMYIFFNQIFHYKYTSILAILLFLILDALGVNPVYTLSRLQCALPQEFGFYNIFLCAGYLISYVKTVKQKKKMEWNYDLFIFMMAIAASIAIHFYITMMAALVCIPVVICMPRRVFCKAHFIPLFCAAVCSVVIAATPMVTAFMMGTPLQGSLVWALKFFNVNLDRVEVAPLDGEPGDTEGIIILDNGTIVSTVDNGQGDSEQQSEPKVSILVVAQEKAYEIMNRIFSRLRSIVMPTINGYALIHRETRGRLVLYLSAICVAAALLYKLIAMMFKRLRRHVNFLDGYAIIAVTIFMYVMFYVVPDGIPRLMESHRLTAVEQIMMCSLFFVPVDLILYGISKKLRFVTFLLTAACFVCAVFGVIATDHYHGYMLLSLTQYNGASNALHQIIRDLPAQSYTILSPTDELSKVSEYSYHEEIQDLMAAQTSGIREHYLPTKYVFVFFEKETMSYAQYHLVSGPEWLAVNDKYNEYFGVSFSSYGDDYISITTEDRYADLVIPPGTTLWDQYKNINYRVIWEARLKVWIEKFKKTYPDAINVYYEDDHFICYCITQTPQCTFNMILP